MTGVLQRVGLVKPGVDLPVSSGANLEPGAGQTVAPLLYEEYNKLRLWQTFVQVPKNHAFFEAMMGAPVEFAPIGEYRSRAPTSRETYWHQDGYYSQQFHLRTAWIPVMDVDTEMGGIKIASGLHHDGYLHDDDTDEIKAIPESRIPEGLCRQTNYHLGDVLVFGEFVPHTGLPNGTTKNLYRLSFDVRFYRAGNRGYLQGKLRDVGDDWITVDCDDGKTRRLAIRDRVVLRSKSGETLMGPRLSRVEDAPRRPGYGISPRRPSGVRAACQVQVPPAEGFVTATGDTGMAERMCAPRRAITDTVVRYAFALDRRDWALLDQVFAEEAVAHYRTGTFHGRYAILAMIRSHLGGCGPSQHLLGNHWVEVDGDRATSTCSVRALHLGAGSRADLTPFEVCGTYRDVLCAYADGWRIVERWAEWTISRGDWDVLQPG
jgi:hypothetical protein